MVRRLPLFLCLTLTLLLAGCGRDDSIRSYSVPVARHRVLAAMVRQADQAWFFKVAGSAADLAAVEPAIRKFLASVTFQDGKPKWTLPEGWKQKDESSPARFATIQLGGAKDLSLSVHTFPVPASMDWEKFRLANINRWRAEVEQGELIAEELSAETEILKMGGAEATVLDVQGSLPPELTTVEVPFGMEIPEPEQLPFDYVRPPQWTQKAAGMMQAAAFEVREGDAEVEISISSAAGNLAANLDRWRKQIGLPETGKAEGSDGVQTIQVNGRPAVGVLFVGAEETIQGAIVTRNDSTWFFKLKGDNALAARERERFDAFVQSIRFR